jgi:hypothetical protein
MLVEIFVVNPTVASPNEVINTLQENHEADTGELYGFLQ